MDDKMLIKVRDFLKKYAIGIIMVFGLVSGHFVNANHIAALNSQIDSYQETVNNTIDAIQSFVDHGNQHKA